MPRDSVFVARALLELPALVAPPAFEALGYPYIVPGVKRYLVLLRQDQVAPREHERLPVRDMGKRLSYPGAGALLASGIYNAVADIREGGKILLQYLILIIPYYKELPVGELPEEMEEHRQVVYGHESLRLVMRKVLHPGPLPACLDDYVLNIHSVLHSFAFDISRELFAMNNKKISASNKAAYATCINELSFTNIYFGFLLDSSVLISTYNSLVISGILKLSLSRFMAYAMSIPDGFLSFTTILSPIGMLKSISSYLILFSDRNLSVSSL